MNLPPRANPWCLALCSALVCLLVSSAALAAPEESPVPPVTLDNHIPPKRNVIDEPFIKEFSYQRAARFTDRAAMDWQESHNCITCHTNGLYLATRPAAGLDSPAYREARRFAANYLKPHVLSSEEPARKIPGIEGMVATTAFLAISDIKTNQKLGAVTKSAFDYIWTKQDEAGAWNKWIKCHWGPYEVDDHFGVTLVALALGVAREDDYVRSEKAVAGSNKVRAYLKNNPPQSLHQKGMMLWASAHLDKLAGPRRVKGWQDELFAAQKEGGGWVLPELGDAMWKRSDNKAQSTEPDGYATAFAIHVLSESGVVREDPRLERARTWLKSQQRESGRWFTRSPRKDNKHYISHAATNLALPALAPKKDKQERE